MEIDIISVWPWSQWCNASVLLLHLLLLLLPSGSPQRVSVLADASPDTNLSILSGIGMLHSRYPEGRILAVRSGKKHVVKNYFRHSFTVTPLSWLLLSFFCREHQTLTQPFWTAISANNSEYLSNKLAFLCLTLLHLDTATLFNHTVPCLSEEKKVPIESGSSQGLFQMFSQKVYPWRRHLWLAHIKKAAELRCDSVYGAE